MSLRVLLRVTETIPMRGFLQTEFCNRTIVKLKYFFTRVYLIIFTLLTSVFILTRQLTNDSENFI